MSKSNILNVYPNCLWRHDIPVKLVSKSTFGAYFRNFTNWNRSESEYYTFPLNLYDGNKISVYPIMDGNFFRVKFLSSYISCFANKYTTFVFMEALVSAHWFMDRETQAQNRTCWRRSSVDCTSPKSQDVQWCQEFSWVELVCCCMKSLHLYRDISKIPCRVAAETTSSF